MEVQNENKIKTPFQIEKEEREAAIYRERNELMSQPGAMATAVDQHLMQKYGIYAKSTIWFICKRVEKRLREEARVWEN